jgi:hypothetical protein
LCFHTCVAVERERGTCLVSAASCVVALLHDLITRPRFTSACEEYTQEMKKHLKVIEKTNLKQMYSLLGCNAE